MNKLSTKALALTAAFGTLGLAGCGSLYSEVLPGQVMVASDNGMGIKGTYSLYNLNKETICRIEKLRKELPNGQSLSEYNLDNPKDCKPFSELSFREQEVLSNALDELDIDPDDLKLKTKGLKL